MNKNSKSIKMPEVLVFVKALILGFVLSELFRVAYIAGGTLSFSVDVQSSTFIFVCVVPLFLLVVSLVVSYAILRGVSEHARRIFRSRRIDLLAALVLGIGVGNILQPMMKTFHGNVEKIDPSLILLLTSFVLLMFLSSLVREVGERWPRRKREDPQIHFLTDDAIQTDADDALANVSQVINFAKIVVSSGSSSGLIYGIDAPWGTGKTSFINLAEQYWKNEASNEVIVFRFELLRYASDADLTNRLIRELTAVIQRQVFVPEFRSKATRYSRMLNGKANFSFFGFKLDIEPTTETIDDLLDDVDEVLKRIRRRLIIVIDDLDRLESKAVNNVLFTVQKTFKLTQAAYILCYDTENLASNKEEGERARQFLEKFVNVKTNLFVDIPKLVKFLRHDWNGSESKYPTIPPETMLRLGSLLSELADILEDKDLVARYMPLIGDMRKVKRFVNAALVMKLEELKLEKTDFNNRDLTHLILLSLNYPGVFRHIYVEESGGRSGVFSVEVSSSSGNEKYSNAAAFSEIITEYKGTEEFLLSQLFKVEKLGLNEISVDESVYASRACFNSGRYRNLEKYLDLMVKLRVPKSRDTFRLYQNAISEVIGGTEIRSVLSSGVFLLLLGETAHDEFWRVLVDQSYGFESKVADDAIDTLIEFLPRYSSINSSSGRALRHRSIYALIRLLDRAGWGKAGFSVSHGGNHRRRPPNTSENVVEIAYRIFGELRYSGKSLIEQVWNESRGVLGLYDLMLFRLQCSEDRQGQVFNLYRALIAYGDSIAPTVGQVTGEKGLAVVGMRTLSQRIFSLFKERYIDAGKNLFDDIDDALDATFLGESAKNKASDLHNEIQIARASYKSFIVYQLANRHAGTGDGVGCGFYDFEGNKHTGEIAQSINDYLFEVCFNPTIKKKNVEHFVNYCLSNLTSGIQAGRDDVGYLPTKRGLADGLDVSKLKSYWETHNAAIRNTTGELANIQVFTSNYVANYKDDLPQVFAVLDSLVTD